jgi:hypothetical protein
MVKNNYETTVTIVYIPTVDNNKVEYINTYYPTIIDTKFYNIDDRDQMIQDMNTQMPYE